MVLLYQRLGRPCQLVAETLDLSQDVQLRNNIDISDQLKVSSKDASMRRYLAMTACPLVTQLPA